VWCHHEPGAETHAVSVLEKALGASTEILIGDGDAQHVLIRPLFRSHPGLFDYWDGNWIDCELQIVAGGFRGRFRADLRSEEFHTFLEEVEGLSRTVQGTASFSTMEGQIAFSLTDDGQGHVRVTGEAIDVAGIGNRLQFAFDIDQTHLPPICQSLEHLLAAFPVTGAADA
jgi:hypothetical protein